VGSLVAATVAVALAGPPLAGATAAPARTSPYVLPGVDVFPEGIATQGGTYYVSSTTDGTIYRGDVRERAARVFLPGGTDGRTTAVGVAVAGDRLVVAGGSTGLVFVYDTTTRALVARFSNGVTDGSTFLNDVAIAPNGDAYVTDSLRPVLYRIPAASLSTARAGTQPLPGFVDFTGTALEYQQGFNANGIEATPDGRYLLVVQSNTGRLFRIATADRSVRRVDLGGASLSAGDGMLLTGGRTLYVVRNALAVITEVKLRPDYLSGVVRGETTDPSFRFPTTLDEARGRVLVVNSQFDKRGGNPEEPFTVSSLKRP